MTLRLARVTLRLHRFEVVAALLAVVAFAAWAAALIVQLDAVAVPAGCLQAYAASDAGDAPAMCFPALDQYSGILIPWAQDLFQIASFLPFATGLLVSVPIVSRELETGTAQTAWSLDAFRARWLTRRTWPILLPVAMALVLAAVATDLLAARDYAAGGNAMVILGQHGLPLLARMLAAFGIGLLAGSLVPRTLPALVVAALVCALLFLGILQLRDVWLHAQPAVPWPEGATRMVGTGWQWWSPDGQLITQAEASALVPDDVEMGDRGQAQPLFSMAYLEDRGYSLTAMGIPSDDAQVWGIYDAALFMLAGAGAAAAAFVVVDRRKPS